MKGRFSKLLASLLAIAMAVALLPGTAFAEETNEAQIGDTKYATLAEAVTAANEAGTADITLLKDVTVPGASDLNDVPTTTFTGKIDLNKNTLKFEASSDCISVGTNSTKESHVTICNGTIESSITSALKAFWGTLELKDCTVTATWSVSGSSQGLIVVQSGSLIISESTEITLTSNYSGDSTTDLCVIKADGGTTTINGGTIKLNLDEKFQKDNECIWISNQWGNSPHPAIVNFNGGTIDGGGARGVVFNNADTSHTMNISDGIITNCNYGIFVAGNGTVNMTGGEITNCGVGISGNGVKQSQNTTVNISGDAKIDVGVGKLGIYQPQNGTTTISDNAVISGDSAVAIKSGTLNIDGGTLTAVGEFSGTHPTEGANLATDSSAIVVDDEAGNYYGHVVINITGGTFTSKESSALSVTRSKSTDAKPQISISGGSFTSGKYGEASAEAPAIYLADDAKTNAKPTVTGGDYSSDVKELVPGGSVFEKDGRYYVGAQHTVTYAKGSVSSATNMPGGTDTAVEGYAYTIPAQAPNGDSNDCFFMGWKSSGDNEIYMPGESIENITENITLTAQWEDSSDFNALFTPAWKIEPEHYQSSTKEITLTCTLTNNTGETFTDWGNTTGTTNMNNGPAHDSEITSKLPATVSPRDKVEIVIKLTFEDGLAGYWDTINYELLVGWMYHGGKTYMSNFTVDVTRAPDSVVTVSFDDGVEGETGEVTGMPDAFKAEKDGSANLPDDTPVRKGYVFTGWLDGEGDLYRPGDTIEAVPGDMTLTARWEEAPSDIEGVESFIPEPEVTFPEDTDISQEDQAALSEAAKNTDIDRRHMNELAAEAMKDPSHELPASTGEAAEELAKELGKTVDESTVHIVVETFLDVTVENYTHASGGDSAVLTYDVTPMYRVVATTADKPSEIQLEGEEKNAVVLGDEHELPVNEPVTLTLGLPSGFAVGNYVYINHTKDGINHWYTGRVTGNKVTFTNPHGFSTFAVYSQAPKFVARIVNTYYASLQAAVNAVDDEDTIDVMTDEKLTATAPAKEITFTVVGPNGGVPNVEITDNGNYHVSRSGNTYTVTYVAPPVPTTPTPSNPDTPDKPDTDPVDVFVDVPAEAWYRDALNYVLENTTGVINGTDATHFSPNEKLTRAAFAKILWAIEGSKPTTAENPFTDVKSGDWFYDAVIWANAQGIMLGKGENLCAPNDNITREEMALMIQRWKAGKAAGGVAFPDAKDVHDWAADAVAWAAEQSYIKGKDDGRFAPLDSLTRAEMITVVARTLGYEG